MKTFKELLIELSACSEARIWAEDKTIEQVVKECHRGDWLLWLAAKVNIGLQPLILAKGHCANTVRHLMKEKQSIKAVDTAIAFGEGKATREELDAASAAAYASASAAAYASASAASASAYAYAYASASAYVSADASAASASAYASAYASASASAYASAYASSAASDAAKKENQLQTANICRKYIGDLIIDKVYELLNTNEK